MTAKSPEEAVAIAFTLTLLILVLPTLMVIIGYVMTRRKGK